MTWCPDINSGLYVRKESQTNEVSLGFCCISRLSPVTNCIDFDNPWLTEQRTQDRPSACIDCIRAESNGVTSRRQGLIKFYQDNNIPIISDKLINLDYNCENVCNAKCIMCNSRYSSLWIEDERKLKSVTIAHKSTKHNKLIHNLDFSKLRRLHFNGGEPLLSNDHRIILEKVIASGAADKCQISYNTNGSVIPKKDILDLWKRFNLVKLQFSIDAVGPAFNYIRFPLDWAQVSENLDYWKKFSDFNIWYSLNVALGLHNILYLDELIEWQQKNFSTNKQTDPVEVDLQVVFHEILNLQNLPNKHRKPAQDILEKLGTKYTGFASYFINCPDPNEEWVHFLNKLDQIRNTNWKDSLSRLL